MNEVVLQIRTIIGKSNMSDYIPNIPDDLIKFLDDRVPSKDFSPSDSLREIDFYMGKRELVNFLKTLHEDQLENQFLTPE
uniref:Uncharacterized protein n=1 Tax=uncultured marine virus TaxID=186617 RepID=A0A0F7L5U3_9VIRU|nr:hypothetical protein [uncultured marine virus]